MHNKCVTGIPKGKERMKQKKIFAVIILENFTKFMTDTKPQA